MRKTIITCDCCFKEVGENEVYPVEHYIHVSPSFNRVNGHVKVIDGATYSISGRTEKREFCLPCYNAIFQKFFEAIKERQNNDHEGFKTED